MSTPQIRLLQFFVCNDFKTLHQDCYVGECIQSNMFVPRFPHHFDKLLVVTCWRKDHMFHKEVIEYVTEDGDTHRTPHMDIEPAKGSVLFRWHRHHFPKSFAIKKPTLLTIRVILDWKVHFESYILIEKKHVRAR